MMKISLRNIGLYGGNPAKIIEMSVEGWDSEIIESVTELNGYVPLSLIENLRQVADELEEQNNKLNEKE